MIPEAAVEAAARAIAPLAWGPSVWQLAAHGETPTATRDRAQRESLEQARAALEAAASLMQAAALREAADHIEYGNPISQWLCDRADELEGAHGND